MVAPNKAGLLRRASKLLLGALAIGMALVVPLERLSNGQFSPAVLAAQFMPWALAAGAVLSVPAVLLRLRFASAVFLAAVGILAIDEGCRALARTGEEAGLRVVTFNLGAQLGDATEVVEFLEGCGADVVALQELTHDMAQRLDDTLAERYPHRVLLPDGVYGMGVLSRHAIVSHELVGAHPRMKHLLVELDRDGEPLRLLDVHATWRNSYDGRNAPAASDFGLFAALGMERERCIVLGDFNTTAWTSQMRDACSAGLANAFSTVGVGFGFTFPVEGRWRRFPAPVCVRIDHVLHTDSFRAARCVRGPSCGSDHYPLVADLVDR